MNMESVLAYDLKFVSVNIHPENAICFYAVCVHLTSVHAVPRTEIAQPVQRLATG